MPIGRGKYDDLCQMVRRRADAQAAVVVVLGGTLGSGFSVHGDLMTMEVLPDMLEELAKKIRADLKTTSRH